MADKPKGHGILIALGPSKDEESASAKDEACRAMFDALKEDDYDAFKDALALYLDERDAEYSDEPEEGDDDSAA